MATKKAIGKASHDDDAPKKKSSLAAAFNASKGSAIGLSVGKHQCNITDMQFIENDKGASVMVEYTAHEDDDDAGKKSRQYYKLLDAEENVCAGVDFLKGDLAKLGYADVDFDDLEATLSQIRKEEPLVEIKCVQNGQYLNAYLQGVIDSD